MTQARIRFIHCFSPEGLHRMYYKEWGDAHNPRILMCVHGLTRSSDDFDDVARALSSHYRIICPDVVGRGRSDWLKDYRYYQIPQYVNDMITLLARVSAGNDIESIDWIGTSMGGIIGMYFAAFPEQLVSRLILNDIGPSLNISALLKIGSNAVEDEHFKSFDEAVKHIKELSPGFGQHTEAEWEILARRVLKQDKDGRWVRYHDSKLGWIYQEGNKEMLQQIEIDLWKTYHSISCPILLIRGAQSDLLSKETAQKMTQERKKTSYVELEGVGHAPTLMHQDQINIVKQFLLS